MKLENFEQKRNLSKVLAIGSGLFGLAIAISTSAKFGRSKIDSIKSADLKLAAQVHDKLERQLGDVDELLEELRALNLPPEYDALTQAIIKRDKNVTKLIHQTLPQELMKLHNSK